MQIKKIKQQEGRKVKKMVRFKVLLKFKTINIQLFFTIHFSYRTYFHAVQHVFFTVLVYHIYIGLQNLTIPLKAFHNAANF
jgi:hypothetical protein